MLIQETLSPDPMPVYLE